MLKGKAIIELTDVNTGEKTVQVEDNIMTNALSCYFNPPLSHMGVTSLIAGNNNQLFAYNQPNLSWATSGIVVSNQEQVESPDTLEIPLSTVIGAAAKQYKVQIESDNRYGEYNESESVIDNENGIFSHVFDFPTSACNGTVRCLSIMHPGGVIGLPYAEYDSFKENLDIVYRRKFFVGAQIAASASNNTSLYHPCPGFRVNVFDTIEGTTIGSWSYRTYALEQNHYSDLATLQTIEKVLAYDVEKGFVYTLYWTSANTFVIRCRASNIASINAIANFKLLKEYPEVVVDSQVENTRSYGIACIDKVTQKAYYITAPTNSSTTVNPNETIRVYEVDLIEGTTRTFNVPNVTGTTLYLSTSYYEYARYETRAGYGKQSALVHNGNIYIRESKDIYGKDAAEQYVWFKIPLDNPSNVTECKMVNGFKPINGSTAMGKWINLIDDKYLYIDSGHILNIENDTIYNDYSTDTIISTYGVNITSIPLIGSKFTMFTYFSGDTSYNHTEYVGIFTRLDMPITINNLSTPIHKTPSQTMKITYVLKEVEPEDTNTEGGETV
jgi:hypothetical protein